MGGGFSKAKGKRGEREARDDFAFHLRLPIGKEGVYRGVQYQGGTDSPDIVIKGLDVHVEVKRVEALNLYKAIEQAEQDAGGKRPYCVWHRKNNKPSVAIVPMSQLAVSYTHLTLPTIYSV